MPQRLDGGAEPHHEGIEALHQPLDLARHILADRLQVVGVALGNRRAQPAERPQRHGHRDPDNDGSPGDHHGEAQSRAQQDGAGKLTARHRGFGDGDDERHRGNAGRGRALQRRDPDRLTAKHRILEGRRLAGLEHDPRQRLIPCDEAAGRPIDAVEDAILRRRGQHFQRHIGNIHLQRPVLGDDDTLGNRQRRAGQHPVGDRIRRLHRLRPGIEQRQRADNRGGNQQPAKQAAAQRMAGRQDHAGAKPSSPLSGNRSR